MAIARPGIDHLRPKATGDIPNLYLAGDWCDTGWPATMEGAVRSGYGAAAVLESLGTPVNGMCRPDLNPGSLYRFLSRDGVRP